MMGGLNEKYEKMRMGEKEPEEVRRMRGAKADEAEKLVLIPPPSSFTRFARRRTTTRIFQSWKTRFKR